MANLKAANRYAKGLMQFVEETNQTRLVYDEMIDIIKSLRNNKELVSFLNTPVLDEKKKSQIAKDIFKDFSKPVQTFIQLIIRHGRENILREIAFQYITIYDEENGIYQAVLYTADSMDDQTADYILSKAKKAIGADKTYSLHKVIDPDLIGGFRLRVGDKMIDASLRTKLNKIKKDLEDYNYIPKI